MVADTTAHFQPLFEAVARLTPEVMAETYRASCDVGRMAAGNVSPEWRPPFRQRRVTLDRASGMR